jgi:tetratricopeptide (TPR) repeat protein
MPVRHLDLPTLRRFAVSRLDRDRMIEAGRHLFACPSCRTRMREEVMGGAAILRRLHSRWAAVDEDYESMFDRLHTLTGQMFHAARQERQSAGGLLEEVATLSPEARSARLREDTRFHKAALVDLLLERARALWGEDTAAAEQYAELALEVVERLSSAIYSKGLIFDLEARSWAYVGQARRMRSDLRGAETAIGKAETLLEEGSCEPLERACLLEVKAALLRAQQRFAEALKTAREAAAIYRRVRDRHLEARARATEAMILDYAGQPEAAIDLLFQVMDCIDATRDPRLAYSVRHNLLGNLVNAGRAVEAAVQLPEVRSLGRQVAKSQDLIRLDWIEAQIDLQFCRYEEAEAKLDRVRDQYLRLGDDFLAALVSLDLARLYLEQGRTADTRRLAAEMQPIFAVHNIRREAIAALLVFQQAAEKEAATVLLVQEVARRIRRVELNPAEEPERPA